MNFTYKSLSDHELIIHYNGSEIKRLKGVNASQTIHKLEAASTEEVQLILAKITGNFKRGNERQSRNHPRNRKR